MRMLKFKPQPHPGRTAPLGLVAEAVGAGSLPMVVTDPAPRILAVNRAFTELTGWKEHEVLGSNPRILRSGRHSAGFYRDLWSRLSETGSWEGTLWDRRRDGTVYCRTASITASRGDGGELRGYVALFCPPGVDALAGERLRRLAYRDSLTGLPNRRMLDDRLDRALALAHRRKAPMALMVLDLDGFKQVNDEHGHGVGDDLLRAVGERLTAGLRDVDTVARIGGDEFVILVPEAEDRNAVERVADRILELLLPAFSIGHRSIRVQASIGISTYPDDGAAPDDLLFEADRAMYRVKRARKGRFAFASEGARRGGFRTEAAARCASLVFDPGEPQVSDGSLTRLVLLQPDHAEEVPRAGQVRN